MATNQASQNHFAIWTHIYKLHTTGSTQSPFLSLAQQEAKIEERLLSVCSSFCFVHLCMLHLVPYLFLWCNCVKGLWERQRCELVRRLERFPPSSRERTDPHTYVASLLIRFITKVILHTHDSPTPCHHPSTPPSGFIIRVCAEEVGRSSSS